MDRAACGFELSPAKEPACENAAWEIDVAEPAAPPAWCNVPCVVLPGVSLNVLSSVPDPPDSGGNVALTGDPSPPSGGASPSMPTSRQARARSNPPGPDSVRPKSAHRKAYIHSRPITSFGNTDISSGEHVPVLKRLVSHARGGWYMLKTRV